MLLGDFDLDSDPDLFVVNTNGDQIYTNVGTASGTFALHPQQLQNADARMAAAGKFSVDDRVDVAVIAGGGASVFFNDGAANFGQGDVAGPTVQLRGEPTMTLIVGDTVRRPGRHRDRRGGRRRDFARDGEEPRESGGPRHLHR